MNLKIFGVNVYVSPLFFLVLTAILFVDRSGTALPVFAAIFIHEAGHLTVMKAIGQEVRQIKLIPAAVIVEGSAFTRLKDDLLVSSAGVLSNAVYAALFYAFHHLYPVFLIYSAANIGVALFNLYPAKGLDGGKILYILLQKYTENPDRIFIAVSLGASVLVVGAAVIGVLLGIFNFTIIFFALYIVICTLLKV